jgi:hypothetical protein
VHLIDRPLSPSDNNVDVEEVQFLTVLHCCAKSDAVAGANAALLDRSGTEIRRKLKGPVWAPTGAGPPQSSNRTTATNTTTVLLLRRKRRINAVFVVVCLFVLLNLYPKQEKHKHTHIV